MAEVSKRKPQDKIWWPNTDDRHPQSKLPEKDAAKHLGMSVRTLQKMRSERRGPAYIKIGKSVRYMMADLQAFIECHRIVPEA